jgi:hypothetical protein
MTRLINDPEPRYPGNFKNALEGFDKNGDGNLDFDEFQIMTEECVAFSVVCLELTYGYTDGCMDAWTDCCIRFPFTSAVPCSGSR